jgi:hypothetical protein
MLRLDCLNFQTANSPETIAIVARNGLNAKPADYFTSAINLA